MEVSKILAEYDAMLAAGRRREAGEFLSEAADVAAREDDAVSEASLRGELTGYWRVFGEPEKSFASAERALFLLESRGLGESAAYATALLNYATAKTAFRMTDEALALYGRVAEIYEKTVAPGDYRFASLYNNMAQALMRAGRASEALGYFERSLALLSPPEDAAEIATCRTNMAYCLTAEKKLDEAERSLALAEEIYSALPDDPHLASALSCRGQLSYIRGEYARAAEYFAKSAETVERFFGRTANYAAACRSCAKSFEAAGMADEAAKYRALADAARGAR
ncbi:tetratricopeptide repeat protein [Cloacibacillus sp. An23]|uniref:tetratricopeptide repeat protein n=1 Tax=Cloacibacillus sp. An23 TaxID=1965591 RepID=UPI000B372222|nr:tetratricopeptide repeat protein [Cloacibacillus sp. An23]OUO94053.1 hypothetical protein B5F39_05145 [Cloacibacillus sp. An23]